MHRTAANDADAALYASHIGAAIESTRAANAKPLASASFSSSSQSCSTTLAASAPAAFVLSSSALSKSPEPQAGTPFLSVSSSPSSASNRAVVMSAPAAATSTLERGAQSLPVLFDESAGNDVTKVTSITDSALAVGATRCQSNADELTIAAVAASEETKTQHQVARMPNGDSHSHKTGTEPLSNEVSPANRRNTIFFKQTLQSAVLEAADLASQNCGRDIDSISHSSSSASTATSSASAAASSSDHGASNASNGPVFRRQASLAHLDGADSARATSIAQQARFDQEARTRAANEQRAWDDFVAKFTGVGFRVRKHGRWGAPHERQLVFETATQQVSWGSTSDAKFSLSAVQQIVTGKDTDCLQRTDASVLSTHCFSLITADRTLDLQTGSAAERDFLVFNLRKLRALSEAPQPKQRSGWSGHPEF